MVLGVTDLEAKLVSCGETTRAAAANGCGVMTNTDHVWFYVVNACLTATVAVPVHRGTVSAEPGTLPVVPALHCRSPLNNKMHV